MRLPFVGLAGCGTDVRGEQVGMESPGKDTSVGTLESRGKLPKKGTKP